MSQGNILLFRNSEMLDHKLILFVGRGPENVSYSSNRIGSYGDGWTVSRPTDKTTTSFVDRIYGACGKITEHESTDLKRTCVSHGASAVALADVSPLSFTKNCSSTRKLKLRQRLAASEYRDHIESVFSHTQIIDRVSLVVCSGLHRSGVTVGREVLEEYCTNNKIDFCHTDSFSSAAYSNAHRVEQLGNAAKSIKQAFAEVAALPVSREYQQAVA